MIEISLKNYYGVDYNYFDSTLEYFSYDHLFDNDAKNENTEPQFINSCVIKIGEVKSFIKNEVDIKLKQSKCLICR